MGSEMGEQEQRRVIDVVEQIKREGADPQRVFDAREQNVFGQPKVDRISEPLRSAGGIGRSIKEAPLHEVKKIARAIGEGVTRTIEEAARDG